MSEQAELNNKITDKFCWSNNEEEFYGYCDTLEEAQGEAIEFLESDWYEKGDEATYYIGRCVHPLDYIKSVRIIDVLIENMIERIYDEVGGDVEAIELSQESKQALNTLMMDFLYKNAKVNRWGVKDTYAMTHIIEGDKDE